MVVARGAAAAVMTLAATAMAIDVRRARLPSCWALVLKVGDGLLLHKTKASSCPKASSVAHAAELLVCRSCNIAKDGEGVTAAALDAFTDRFKEHMSL
ncbi:hypothetical protein ZWY2020_028196 [Hordeum vulgare]|nr:hypothetical protein ZWY2020_028196 [Hordeum vulgare]